VVPLNHILAAGEANIFHFVHPHFQKKTLFVFTLVFADDLFSRVLAMPHSTSQVESGSGWTRKSLSTRGAKEKAKAKPKAKAKAERPRARARGSLAIAAAVNGLSVSQFYGKCSSETQLLL